MEMWHVLNRGVEKRKIAMNDADRMRFVHDLYIFNDVENVDPNHRFDKKWTSDVHNSEKKPLVQIHAWCLMSNHYHLLLSEKVPEGLPLFLKKLNGGYAKYFNEKYDRSGALWQGKTKKILIVKDAHYLHIPYYIHLNPLDVFAPEWREGRVKDSNRALAELRKYRWSSHLDYLGEHNFPSVISMGELHDVLGEKNVYEQRIKDAIADTELNAGGQNLE